MSENGNALAYPCQPLDHGGNPSVAFQRGLTKREAFAMAAMQGMCASDDYAAAEFAIIAGNAVMQADALLAELDKQP